MLALDLAAGQVRRISGEAITPHATEQKQSSVTCLTQPYAVKQIEWRGEKMKTVGDRAWIVGKCEVGSRGVHRCNHAKVKVEFLSVRPGEAIGLTAARLERFGRFRRWGRWLVLHTVRAVTAFSDLGRCFVRAGGRHRKQTAPSLGEGQEEGVAEDQASHEYAHTLILRWIDGKGPRQYRHFAVLRSTGRPRLFSRKPLTL